jgi:hypothetical protein
MRASLSILLALLVLFQSTSRVWIVLGYELNQPGIVQLLCINKAKPQLDCKGKCFLKKQLQKAQETDGKEKKTLSFPSDDFIQTTGLLRAISTTTGVIRNWTILPDLYSLLRTSAVFHPPCPRG